MSANPQNARKRVKPRCPQCGLRKDLYDDLQTAQHYIKLIKEKYGQIMAAYPCVKKWHLTAHQGWKAGHWSPEAQSPAS